MKPNGIFASSLVAPLEGEPLFDPYVVVYLEDRSRPTEPAQPMTAQMKTDVEIDSFVDRMIANLEQVRTAAKTDLAHAKADTVRMALRGD